MNENPPHAKGWVASIKFNNCICNRGCEGFETEKEAQKWLDDNLDYIVKCYYLYTLTEAKVYKI